MRNSALLFYLMGAVLVLSFAVTLGQALLLPSQLIADTSQARTSVFYGRHLPD